MDKMQHRVKKCSVQELAYSIRDGHKAGKKFCFILGAGASADSGIPSGQRLEYIWMNKIMKPGNYEWYKRQAHCFENFPFDVIQQEWECAKMNNRTSLDSKYYFDIYKLRFHDDYNQGYYFLERIMENVDPSIGYCVLSKMLDDSNNESNIVITTNFDALMEDSFRIFTAAVPVIINHESMAQFAYDPNRKRNRPVIAKIHRGVLFDPLNTPKELEHLAPEWDEALKKILADYIPVVIGYGGADNTLMHLLSDNRVILKNGIYWCYYAPGLPPDDRIMNLLRKKNGTLVSINGFDSAMWEIGQVLYPGQLYPDQLNAEWYRQIRRLTENYRQGVLKLMQSKPFW